MARDGRTGRGLAPPPRLWLTEQEVAEMLAVSDRTVRMWRAEGRLPSVKVGKARRYHVDDVAAFADSLRPGHIATKAGRLEGDPSGRLATTTKAVE